MANGIPSLLTTVTSAANNAALLVADAKIVLNMFGPPKWGVYLNGTLVLEADSVLAVEFRQDWNLPDYPMEEGAFGSYNKVERPYDVRVSLSKGGSVEDRQSFLAVAQGMGGSLDLYDVVTPEVTYSNVNIAHLGYRRTSTNGVGLLTVELGLIEIRNTGTAAFSNTTAPSGSDPVNTGAVQAQPATPAQASNATVGPNGSFANNNMD